MTLTRSPATATATVVGGGKGAAATAALYPLRTRFTTVAVLTLLLLLLLDAPVASALNTCEEITRCSECVYDQTQGIMPPSLQCGWCASTQTCKEVNATVLAYYGVHKSTGNKHQTRTITDDENNESEFTPEEMAAFVASFCPDLREREVNGECLDMTCIAAKTTNNIYICRPPPIIALVFGCLLFVLTVVVFVWMRAIRQLPWRYEPFLSDMLEGRLRSYDETAMEEEEGEDGDYSAESEDDDHDGNKDGAHRAEGRGGQLSSSAHHSTPFPQRARAGGDKLNATRPGSPFTDGPQPPSQLQESEEEAAGRKQQQQQQKSNRSNNGKGEYASPSSSSSSSSYANDSPSAETASTASNPSYIGEASHNVVVSHRPHNTTTTTTAAAAPTHTAAAALSSALAGAATGYCPICKCRQPAYLGPGEVCFWCNVARFTFVPFTIALICAVTVILLDFAVSLKPWFSDWYFSMVLLFAYASYGGMALYMVRHHGRAPLFFFESEAERRANQRIWTATHDRPASALLSASVPPSQPESAKRTSRYRHGSGGGGEGSSNHARHPHHRQSTSASSRRERAASPSRALDQKWHHDRQKLRMLNDARRNMASTYYFHLALQLRGRSLLEVFPELKRYTAQLEALQATPATLTAVGDVMAVMRTPGTANNTGGSSPQSPLGAQFNNPSHHHHGSPNAATATATAAAAGDDGPVPVISPFSTAMPRATADADSRNSSSTNNNNNVAATAPLMGLPLGDDGSPHTLSSPSVSSGYYSSGGAATDHGRLPTLAAVAAMTTPPASQLQTPVPEGATQPGGGAAALQQPQPAPTPAAAAAGGGGSNPIGANAAVATNAMPEALARQKRGETVQLLSSDFLSPQYCRALKSTLYRDEYITWCAKPNMRGVLMENEWLLLVLAAGFLFGLWMVMLASVTDTTYTIVQLSGSTSVSACGLIVMAFFAVLLVIVVRQCGRLYVLTNERLITVYESVITPVTTATDLSTVRFAALYGYRSLLSKQPCLTFSWEVPATERKMPVIKSHKFPGITHLQEFLFFFRLVAPQTPFHLEQISESTRQDRQEWRLHIILCVVAFVMLPIFTIYPQAMPEFLSAYLFVLGLLVLFSTLLRGFRAQQMTYAPLNVAASWAPENEADELDSAAAAAAAAAGNTAGPAPDGNGGGDGAALSPSSKQQQQHPQQHQPGTEGSVVQPLKPSGGQSPTAHRQPTMPKESSGRAVQILTPTARTPTSPSAAAATTLTLPEGGYGPASKPTRPSGLAAAAAAPTIVSVPPSAAAAAAPAVHLAPPSLTITNPAAAASSGLMAGVMPLVPPGVPSIVPVNAAIREVEESFSGLLGVGVSGSANNSFANSAAVHVVGSGSYSGTARDSPHRRRPSTHDSAGSPHAHPGAVTIGPGVAPMPVVTTSRVATNPSTAATSPTHGAPPAYPAGTLPLAGPPNLYAVHAHVGMSRSESDGAMSGRSVNSPASLPIPYATNATAAVSPHNSNNNNNSSGSGSGGSSSRRGRQLSPSHVVAASARSTKHDGHTTWGDQVGDE